MKLAIGLIVVTAIVVVAVFLYSRHLKSRERVAKLVKLDQEIDENGFSTHARILEVYTEFEDGQHSSHVSSLDFFLKLEVELPNEKSYIATIDKLMQTPSFEIDYNNRTKVIRGLELPIRVHPTETHLFKIDNRRLSNMQITEAMIRDHEASKPGSSENFDQIARRIKECEKYLKQTG